MSPVKVMDSTVGPLERVYDWMHKDGEPNPATNMDPSLIVLMDIALNTRKLVNLAEAGMRMNEAIMATLDMKDEDTEIN